MPRAGRARKGEQMAPLQLQPLANGWQHSARQTVPSQKRRKRGFRKQYILYGLSQKCQHLVVDVSLVCWGPFLAFVVAFLFCLTASTTFCLLFHQLIHDFCGLLTSKEALLYVVRVSNSVTLTEKMPRRGDFPGQPCHCREWPDHCQNWCESCWLCPYGRNRG